MADLSDFPDRMERKAERIEAVAKAMFASEHPGRSWDREVAMLGAAQYAYSLAPRFRDLANVALGTARDWDEAHAA